MFQAICKLRYLSAHRTRHRRSGPPGTRGRPYALAIAFLALPTSATAIARLNDSGPAALLGKNPFDSALFGLGLLTVLAALTAVLLLYRASRHNLSELRKSNERLTGYIEATSDWVWQTDEEHRFTYISPQFTEQTGIFTESMIGRSPIDILLKDSPELATRHRKTVEARRPYRDLTYSLVLPDGRRVWFRTNAMPRFDASGRFTGYLGTTRNITEAFTNKRQLDENLAITSHLLDAVPDAIVFCLPDRSIVKVNPVNIGDKTSHDVGAKASQLRLI